MARGILIRMAAIVVALALLIVTLLPMAGLANAAPPAQGESYTVQKDDSLWLIAEKYLGNGAAYPAIVMATNAKHEEDETFAQIVNPSIIQPGWKLWIPSADESAGFVAVFIPEVTFMVWAEDDFEEGALLEMVVRFEETHPWINVDLIIVR